MPFKIRLSFKFNTFCYNILNNKILSSFKNDIVFNNLGYLRHTYEVKIPFDFLTLRKWVFVPLQFARLNKFKLK